MTQTSMCWTGEAAFGSPTKNIKTGTNLWQNRIFASQAFLRNLLESWNRNSSPMRTKNSSGFEYKLLFNNRMILNWRHTQSDPQAAVLKYGSRPERCQSTSRHGTCRCYAQSARWSTDSCHQLVLQLSNWHSLPHLCQVTGEEIETTTKLLEKACQKLRAIPEVPPQRITDLDNATRQPST